MNTQMSQKAMFISCKILCKKLITPKISKKMPKIDLSLPNDVDLKIAV